MPIDINNPVYRQLYVRNCKTSSGTSRLVLVPNQGLTEGFVALENNDPLTEDTYYTVDVSCNPVTSYKTVSKCRASGVPKTDALAEAKARVEIVHKEIEEEKERLKLLEKASFKKANKIPAIPSELFIDDKVWNLASASVLLDKYPLLLGPKGCGKTQTAFSLASALEMEFAYFNLGAANKPKQYFVGMMQAENGNTKLIPSEFLTAYQSEKPLLIFLDEATRLPQSASNYLMTVLDRLQSYLYIEEEGRKVHRGKDVRIIAAGNVGMQYTDTRTLDGAIWDRFIKLTIDYLPPDKELKLIQSKAPKCSESAIINLIEKANKCREGEKNGSLTTGVSTRQLIDMAHYIEMGFDEEEVYETIFLNNFINGNTDESEIVKSIFQS